MSKLDPLRPETFNHCYAWIEGVRYHYVDQKPALWTTRNDLGRLVVCLHGFPDFWYGWRHMIINLNNAGYRVIVPDLKGYAESLYLKVEHDDEVGLRQFALKRVGREVLQLFDQLDNGAYAGKPFTLVAHDWGGLLAWRMAQHFPNRIQAVASFCTPYNPPNKTFISVEQLAKITKGAWNYQVYFNSPKATEELDDSVELFMKLFLRGPLDAPISRNPFSDASETTSMLANLDSADIPYPRGITRTEFDEYVKAYTRSSFNGGLQWYRTRKINHKDELGLNPVISQPALMVTASHDAALPREMTKNMRKYIFNLTMRHIENSGHWLLQEQPDDCSAVLLDWLSQVHGQNSRL